MPTHWDMFPKLIYLGTITVNCNHWVLGSLTDHKPHYLSLSCQTPGAVHLQIIRCSYPNCRAAQLFIWLFAQTYLTHSQIIHRSVNDLAAELSKQSIYTFKPPPLHYPFSKDVRPNLLGLNNPSPVSVLVVEFYNRPCFPVWSFGFIVWRTCYCRVTILMSNKHGTFWIMVSYFDFCVALTEKMYVKVMKSC